MPESTHQADLTNGPSYGIVSPSRPPMLVPWRPSWASVANVVRHIPGPDHGPRRIGPLHAGRCSERSCEGTRTT